MDLPPSHLRCGCFSFYISHMPNYMTSQMYLNPCFLTFCHLLVIQTTQEFMASPRHSVYTSSVNRSPKERKRASAHNEMPTQRTSSLIPPMMFPKLWWLPVDNTHEPQSIFIVFWLQCYISCLPLAPHIQCTWKQKSIILIPQCHHNYSFETAIENKLHLHCLFIRLLWVSNAHGSP